MALAWDGVGVPLGLTPPRGRAGHSVPVPRPLGEGPIFVAPPSSAKKERKKDVDGTEGRDTDSQVQDSVVVAVCK